MNFYIGQIFDGVYPPEAAVWCNSNNAHIESINSKFTIIENQKPKITISDLTQFLYQEKCKVAYSGVTVIKEGIKYIFETNEHSITMCNSMALALATKSDDFTINWKVWEGNIPVLLTITKVEFNNIFAFGMQMINTAFGVEGILNKQVQEFTEKQLQDEPFITQFKEAAINQFKQINTEFTFDVQSETESIEISEPELSENTEHIEVSESEINENEIESKNEG